MVLHVRMTNVKRLKLDWDIDREVWRLEIRGLDPLQLVELLIDRAASVRVARHLRHAADIMDAALAADAQVMRNGAARDGVPIR